VPSQGTSPLDNKQNKGRGKGQDTATLTRSALNEEHAQNDWAATDKEGEGGGIDKGAAMASPVTAKKMGGSEEPMFG